MVAICLEQDPIRFRFLFQTKWHNHRRSSGKKGYGRMEKLHVVSVPGNFDINRTSFLIEQYIIGTAGMYYYGTSGKSRRKLRPHAFSATRSTIILVPLRFDCDFHSILKATQRLPVRVHTIFVPSRVKLQIRRETKGNTRIQSSAKGFLLLQWFHFGNGHCNFMGYR